jgi:hypothetical protein
MLSGKQKKIASKAGDPNKIDAKDFAVLKAEKAKGRGMGLQDEKLEPGKEYMKKGGMTKGQKKVGRVMREFKAGKLHSGKKGPVVKNPKQAIAIALSEAGMSKKVMKAETGDLVTADRLTERDITLANEAVSESTPMKKYARALNEKASSDRLTETDIKNASMVEKAKNIYKKLNSPEMRKAMGTGGSKRMFARGGSVQARGVKLARTRPTKLY